MKSQIRSNLIILFSLQAYQERVKEEEKKEEEMERLEEILDIFTEYQKQLSSGDY